MTDALDVALRTPWTRQGEWGGSTLSRCLIYVGMQRTLPQWTGVGVGFESFLHCGETTYIATGQYERFAKAYLRGLRNERAPLRTFTSRFATLLAEVEEFLPTLRETRAHDEKALRYFQLSQQMQPYSYVFGYGEDQVVGSLLRHLLVEAEVPPELLARTMSAATAPRDDRSATEHLRRLRVAGFDARALDLADLVREQVQVRTDRRVLWNKVERAIEPHLARRAAQSGIPVRLLLEATPQEIAHSLPRRAALEARVGSTFLAHESRAHLLTGEDHARVAARFAPEPVSASGVIEGHSAFPGIVKGRVRIVLTPEDGDELRPGEVLVSDMTTPELTVACGRAGAIVTDRGGMLCHAALVAREMRIPTVLGTETATRALRTGDLVEVDATRGIVRRLTEAA